MPTQPLSMQPPGCGAGGGCAWGGDVCLCCVKPFGIKGLIEGIASPRLCMGVPVRILGHPCMAR